ncbi:MAG: PIN domain-containing protein, partial [Acetobacteraceae bacterium]|nr:PIN domain-containing protein [Acetobacteraceae bacterium]
MVKALFDTNILIDYLGGNPAARTELSRHSERAISIVTWMEVLVGAPPSALRPTRAFLDTFLLVGIDRPVAEKAVELRK